MILLFSPRPPINALRSCVRFKWQNVRIIDKVTREYAITPPEVLKSPPNETVSEKKKRLIRYVFYDPTLAQKLAIMKARFFATGWIWVVTGLITYMAAIGLNVANKHFEKGRYCI
ncbi:hypothetical protein X943_000528 [Babesia divergens]|uniref:Uncharacterized protein n=1 Tax=Babesia divergens TaxID=32595 RepID=A0AAD9GA78_BABDI|nr:hypothetical protein X943_000528 [Babesia divergens]